LFHHGLRLWGETTEATDDDNAKSPPAGRRRGYHPRSGHTARSPETPQGRQRHRPAVRRPIRADRPSGHGLLARGNASFNRWLVHELGTLVPPPATVIELGCWPAIALRELLTAYPAASVVGVDRSPVVLKSTGRRNVPAIAGGRLTLVTGGIEKAVGYTPACSRP
jgi:hypothetical protein